MKKYFTFSSWITLLQKLGKEKYKIFSPQTLEKASGLTRPATLKAIQRLVKNGYLVKLYRKAYANKFSLPSLEEVAMYYGKPCYISLESALADYGVLSQLPLVLTCVTTRKVKRLKAPLGEIIFHHFKAKLFNSFENDKGILRATAEKALLDYLYINLKNNNCVPSLDEFDLDRLDKQKLKKLAKDFPKTVRASLGQIYHHQ